MARHFHLTADGGSRGNPGPAGYGSVITENGKIIAELYDFIGVATNNVAEYSGLIAGLTAINELDSTATVDVKMDSKLVVEQMSGRWQIKHADMRVLAQSARSAHNPSLVTYSWIPRDENSHADRLANKALDQQAGGGEVAQVQQNYLTERLLSTEKATTIYLIRHGETVLTPFKKFSGDGPLNPELTEIGLAQAEKVAAAVAKLNPEVIIASPLKRTTQTAEAVSRATGLPITFEEAWIECSFGIWDGLSIEEVKEKYPAAWFLLEMIVGLPGDTELTVLESLNWLIANPGLWDELNFKGLGINNPKYYTWTSDISKAPDKFGITLKNPDTTNAQWGWQHDTMDGREVGPLVNYISAKLEAYSNSIFGSLPSRHKYLHHQSDMLGLTHEIIRDHYGGKMSVAWFMTTFTMYHNYKVQKLASRGITAKINRLTEKDWLPKDYNGEEYYPLPINQATLL